MESYSGSEADDEAILAEGSKLSELELREIRNSYRNLDENVTKQVDEAGEGGMPIEELVKFVKKSDEIHLKVKEAKRVREAALDAKLLCRLGYLGKMSIEKTQTNFNIFRPVDFANQLVAKMTRYHDRLTEKSWSQGVLCDDARDIMNEVVGIEPMFGALEAEIPERRPRKACQRENEAPGGSQRKAVITEEKRREANEEERQVEEVNRILRVLKRRVAENGNKPIPYLQFVVHPTSFSLTVENMFHVSFLARDSLVEIKMNNGEPFIAPVARSNPSTAVGHSNQFVLSIDPTEWKEIVEVYGIKEACIPNPQRVNLN